MSDAPPPGEAFEGAENHGYAEGAGDGQSLDLGGPIGRLFDGSLPGPSVQALQMDYGLPQPLALIARGILRVSTGDGVPPILEIVLGAALTLVQRAGGDGGESAGELPGDGPDGL